MQQLNRQHATTPKSRSKKKELANLQFHASLSTSGPSRFFAAQSLAARARLCADEDSEIWPQARQQAKKRTERGRVRVRECVCAYIYICTCTCIYTHPYLYLCLLHIYIYVYICMHVCVCVRFNCLCVCACAHVCTGTAANPWISGNLFC